MLYCPFGERILKKVDCYRIKGHFGSGWLDRIRIKEYFFELHEIRNDTTVDTDFGVISKDYRIPAESKPIFFLNQALYEITIINKHKKSARAKKS